MEWLILALAIFAGYFLIEKWKPEWIEKAKSKLKSLIKKQFLYDKLMGTKARPTTADVAADLHAHEVKCEERWKTIFKDTNEIKAEIAGINQTIKMGTFGLFGFIGALLIAILSGFLPIN